MISEKKERSTVLKRLVWQFYRPAYDDQAFVAEGMELLKSLDSTVFCSIPRTGRIFGNAMRESLRASLSACRSL